MNDQALACHSFLLFMRDPAGEIVFVAAVLIALYILALILMYLYIERVEKPSFAARLGMSAGDPLIARAFNKLSLNGRKQIQDPAGLVRMLRERERYLDRTEARVLNKDAKLRRDRAERDRYLLE
jgi:hypothetical protein